jgi:hypothetical protein
MSIGISGKSEIFAINWEIDEIPWICNTGFVDFKTNTEIT